MENKVIALIRTSTTTQEVESQKDDLIKYILADGIKKENIIVVGQAGASAIKVDDAYLANLQKVYDLIDGGNISTVYAWAIDRIGRNELQLFTFKDKLVSNGVQLVIKEPSLRLLNDDGSVNSGIELAFSLFATMAKQEMETKKVRFARAKKRNTEQGRYNGGRVHFGYAVDEDGRYFIEESEAELVKVMFTEYAKGEYSTTKLTKELQNRGYTVRGKAVTLHFVINMLKSTAFIGYTVFKDNRRSYPRIVSDNLFNKVQQQLQNNHKGDVTRQSKHTYLASKLIVCPECGRHWYASNRTYQCIGHKYHGQGLQHVATCPNNDAVSTEWLDIAVWHVAKSCEINYIYNFTDTKAEEAQKQIEVNVQKIATLQSKIDKMEDRKKRIALMFINGDIDAAEQKRQSEKCKTDMALYKDEIAALSEQNDKLQQIADYDPDTDITLIHTGRLSVMGIDENKEEAYKICHRHIKQVTVTPYMHENKMQKLITVDTIIGESFKFLYIPKSKVRKRDFIIKLYKMNGDEITPLYANREFVPSMV